jgi:anti-sigma factor RsiW
MEYKAQLKLQALLDGELAEREADEVTQWVARDREAAALLEELRSTRGALAGFDADVRLPESREFFWSKIEREIQRLDHAAPKRARVSFSYLTLLRRFLVPASAVATVLIAGLMLNRQPGSSGGTVATEMETALADSGAFIYRDFSAGTTLVWLSYPADKEAAAGDETDTFE